MKRLLYVLFLCALSIIGYAQIVVSGTVTDAIDGFPMPGVSVKVQNTTIATVTDVDGKYTISAKPGDVLMFSFLGKVTQNITVPPDGKIDAVLHDDTKMLDEVVVVGYGTMKKSDLTGSVASVSSRTLQTTIMPSVDQMLSGKLAGVQVTQNTGAPGGATSIRIRGASSINNSNEPLYIVDGMRFQGSAAYAGFDWQGGTNGQTTTNPLALISPNDIASIDVLKDASSAAIYGAAGANGVIIITTKRGAQDGIAITYD